MTIKARTEQTIRIARQHLAIGNADAYRRQMTGAIRGSLNAKETAMLKAAMAEDGFAV